MDSDNVASAMVVKPDGDCVAKDERSAGRTELFSFTTWACLLSLRDYRDVLSEDLPVSPFTLQHSSCYEQNGCSGISMVMNYMSSAFPLPTGYTKMKHTCLIKYSNMDIAHSPYLYFILQDRVPIGNVSQFECYSLHASLKGRQLGRHNKLSYCQDER